MSKEERENKGKRIGEENRKIERVTEMLKNTGRNKNIKLSDTDFKGEVLPPSLANTPLDMMPKSNTEMITKRMIMTKIDTIR